MSESNWQPEIGDSSAPPTSAGGVPLRLSVWPTVVGIIGVVYAAMMLMCNTMGFIVPQLYRWGASVQGQNDPSVEVELRVVEQLHFVFIVETVIAELLMLWLLFASIALLRRRSSARIALIGWAIAELVMTVITIGTHALMTHMTAQGLREQGLNNQVHEVWFEGIMGMIFTAVMSVAMPVFMLIWFSRGRVKSEVALWQPSRY